MVMTKDRRKEKQIVRQILIGKDAEYFYHRRFFDDGTYMNMKEDRRTGSLSRCDYLPVEIAAFDRIGGLSGEAEILLNQAIELHYRSEASIPERSNKLFSLITDAVLLGSRVEAELKADRSGPSMSELQIASVKINMAKDNLLQTARLMIGNLMPVTINVKVNQSERFNHMPVLRRIEFVLDEATRRYKAIAAPGSQYLLFKALAILSALKDQIREYITALMSGSLTEEEVRQALVILNKFLTYIAIVVQRFNGVAEDKEMYDSVNGFILGTMGESILLTNLSKEFKE